MNITKTQYNQEMSALANEVIETGESIADIVIGHEWMNYQGYTRDIIKHTRSKYRFSEWEDMLMVVRSNGGEEAAQDLLAFFCMQEDIEKVINYLK